MDWLSFWGSIIGGLIGGIFTFLGVFLTLRRDKKKQIIEERKQLLESKPRLEILSIKDYDHFETDDFTFEDALIEVPIIGVDMKDNDHPKPIYPEEAINFLNLATREYIFQNTGLTEISWISFTLRDPRRLSLALFNESHLMIKNQDLQFTVHINKRFIKHGNTLKLRIFYLKEEKSIQLFKGITLWIWLCDIHGNLWVQQLTPRYNELELPKKCDKGFYDANTSVKKGYELLKHPEEY